MELSTGERVAQAFWFGVIFVVVAAVLHYLTEPVSDGGPRRWSIYMAWLRDRYLIAGSDDLLSSHAGEEVREMVRVPGAEPPSTQYDDAPVFDITQPLPHDQLIRLLCHQINDATGKLYSANKIADFVGGTRADVLAVVRHERSGETAQPYQAEPVTPRTLSFARTLDNGVVVRVDQWGNEFVQDGNQIMPLALYLANEAPASSVHLP